LASEAGRQRGTIENGSVERAGATEIDLSPLRRRAPALRTRQPFQLRPPHPRKRRKVQRLKLGIGARIGVAVASLVVAVERGADRGWVGGVRERHLYIVALADIAHLAEALEQHFAGAK